MITALWDFMAALTSLILMSGNSAARIDKATNPIATKANSLFIYFYMFLNPIGNFVNTIFPKHHERLDFVLLQPEANGSLRPLPLSASTRPQPPDRFPILSSAP